MSRRQTASVLATTLLGTLDTTALLPVIAIYSIAVGADLFQTGIIVGLYSAVHAPANFLFGRIVDRTGRRWPLRFGLAWDAVSLVLYAFATTPLLLALVRVSHGIGGGFVGPSTMSLAAEGAPPERRGRAMAYYGMVIALAFIVGTAMAVPIEVGLGFGGLFFVLAGALVAGLAISFAVREPASLPAPPRGDWREALGFARRREALGGYGAIFSLHHLQGAFVVLVALLIQERFGPALRGASFTVYAIASMVAHYFGGTMADRRGSAVPTILGLVLVAIAMALVPVVGNAGIFLALMALFGVGHGFVFPSASALVARRAPPRVLGLVTGLFYAILVVGVAVGAPAMGAVASATSLSVGITLSAVLVIPGILLAARALGISAARPTTPLAGRPDPGSTNPGPPGG